ncbi:CRISPR-associated protein, Csx11 family [Mesotoga infera]|uniref:CRISPR-associated protein, Csx11 family n=1 Tax=Mesotoga infera TaxID=1236046 RepID=A0A7Z7PNW8_9BACT|nr:CRISPR-associated protein Csx11 [Mesotoga infera]SSC12721.1 CRISPR-associated protein, Csx11 family [Mesotoga infera]
MSKDLTVLAENRDVLLTAEIACWLHMIGKYHEDFISEKNRKLDAMVPSEIIVNPMMSKLFVDDLTYGASEKVADKWGNDRSIVKKTIIKEFIETHKGKPQNPYLSLNRDAHGRGSGTEKGILDDEAYEDQKNRANAIIYPSTAFGFENNYMNIDEIASERHILYNFIQQKLDAVRKLAGQNSAEDLKVWKVLRQEFISTLQRHFSKAIGDTRRPINDVTLWDQTISSVAFFKAELAESLINGYKDPFDKDKYTFRYLHVTFDGESYVAKGTGIGDTITRRKLIDEAFDSAKLLIEVEYPLGLEIYRDTNGITFLIPELSEKLTIDDLVVKKGVSLKQTISEKITASTNWEVTPFFHISERPSRSLYNLGSMISKRPDGNIPYLKLKELWTEKAELCSSCNIRPIEASSRKRGIKFCEECYKRITGRGKQWVENRNNQTVWIDEIADSTGKIALLSFGFSLNSWINKAHNLSTFGNLKKTVGFSFKELTEELSTSNKLDCMPNLKSIGKKHVLNDLKTVDGLYDFMVGSEDLEDNKALTKNEKLALAIWRKPPSFARVRRVWETTSKFWDEALVEIKAVISPITERIVLKVRTNNLNLPPNNAYEAKVNETKFTVFYENKNPKGADGLENFVIIENLDLLAKKLGVEIKKGSRKDLIDELIKEFKDKNIDFFSSNTPLEVLASSRIEGIEIESCNYSPVIEITKDPERFMVLVPADKALEAAKKIKEKYEKEMGKVRNRLPMNLGIVYAGYHTALPAIMDAGRRLIQIDNKEKEWILTKQPEEYSNYFKLYFEDQVWKIPSKMGDCSEDVWYPYFYVDNLDKVEREKRCLSFKGPSGNWLVHVSQLKEGDKVLVTPSYFDFEYLSSASQRFEISYNGESRRRSKDRKHRPYYLDDLDKIERVWVILSTRLSNSQIKKLNTLVEEKRRDWTDSLGEKDETFKSYVENVIDNLRWKQSLAKDEKDTLVDFCVSRKLADVLEIHMSILKDKSEVAE